jgi:hypothetical protein
MKGAINTSSTTAKRRTRGQASVEYLMVSAMMLLIIIPAVFAFMQYSKSQTREVETNQIFRLGSRLAIETQTVYYGGRETKSTIEDQFPGLLRNITYVPLYNGGDFIGGEFVFYITSYSGLSYSSLSFFVPVNVSFNSSAVNWGQGRKRMIFTAREGNNREIYVHLNIT